MSFLPEFRVLCHQLSSVPVVELPCLLPKLSQSILCCRELLSNGTSNSDASDTSVLIHKLKTRLTTLLNGKQSEGRFVAIVLIKAFIDVGGQEVMKSLGPWARGLLIALGKPDPFIAKELCVVTLTKLYILIHNYPNLLREIATTTLPSYVTSCLNLLSPTSTKKVSGIPSSLQEAIFRSFILLISRYASIFRPYSTRIRLYVGQFLAPSMSEFPYIPQSLREAARHLFICLHEAAPKNSCNEEWLEAVTDLVKKIHVTSDLVFRAVIEDWESSVGYVSESVDINRETQGGETSGYLTPWSGIEAGTDKLIGLLEFMAMYFQVDTCGPVSVPIGIIEDMIGRLLSVLPVTESKDGENIMHLNHSIGREEQFALWCRIPFIHTAVLNLWLVIADRIEENFTSLAQKCFDQLVWVFPYGKHSPEFRLVSFELMSRVLLIAGQGLKKTQIDKASVIIKSCCDELYSDRKSPVNHDGNGSKVMSNLGENISLITNMSTRQASSFSRSPEIKESDATVAAFRLLPLFLSHISQDHFSLPTRTMIERAAILSRNKDAMLACVLNPVARNIDREIPSILPHLTQAFTSDNVVEILLRPRMPQVCTAMTRLQDDGPEESKSIVEEMDYQNEVSHYHRSTLDAEVSTQFPKSGLVPNPISHISDQENKTQDSGLKDTNPFALAASSNPVAFSGSLETRNSSLKCNNSEKDVKISVEDISSDDESVHLTMQLDSDLESSGDELEKD